MRSIASRHCASVGTSAQRTKPSPPGPRYEPGVTTIPSFSSDSQNDSSVPAGTFIQR